jgi:hypothetical protein
MSIPDYLNEFENSILTKTKKKIMNNIYSTKFKSTEYSKIYTEKSNLSHSFIEHIITECDKLADKKKSWATNKKFKSFIPFGQLKTIYPILMSYMYNIGNKVVEQKYNLPTWTTQISECNVIKITDNEKNEKMLINNDFNYCIALKKCIITINNTEYNLDIGDGIIFCGKYKFSFSETYFLLNGIKILGGYEFKCEHNIHPNSVHLLQK